MLSTASGVSPPRDQTTALSASMSRMPLPSAARTPMRTPPVTMVASSPEGSRRLLIWKPALVRGTRVYCRSTPLVWGGASRRPPGAAAPGVAGGRGAGGGVGFGVGTGEGGTGTGLGGGGGLGGGPGVNWTGTTSEGARARGPGGGFGAGTSGGPTAAGGPGVGGGPVGETGTGGPSGLGGPGGGGGVGSGTAGGTVGPVRPAGSATSSWPGAGPLPPDRAATALR